MLEIAEGTVPKSIPFGPWSPLYSDIYSSVHCLIQLNGTGQGEIILRGSRVQTGAWAIITIDMESGDIESN